MLTDYHVHLRVDDPQSTPAASAFTAANAERYREVADERGIEELGVAEHVYRFTEALEVWNHPLWVESAHDDIAGSGGFGSRTGGECRQSEIGESDFDFMEEARHQKGIAEFHFEDFEIIERRHLPAAQGKVAERGGSEIEFGKVAAHCVRVALSSHDYVLRFFIRRAFQRVTSCPPPHRPPTHRLLSCRCSSCSIRPLCAGLCMR